MWDLFAAKVVRLRSSPRKAFLAQSAALFAFDGLQLAFMKASACPNYGLLKDLARAPRGFAISRTRLTNVGPEEKSEMNMLQPEYSSVRNNDGAAEMAVMAEVFQSRSDFLRLQYGVIGLAVAMTMGFIYLLTTPSSYTATATMLIDTKKVQLFQQQSMFSEMPIDAGSIEMS